MFLNFLRFELRFWLRGFMVYIFLLIIALMVFGATSTDTIRVGSALENANRNAPHTIQNFYAIMSLLTSLMIAAFVNAAASRDFIYNTDQLIFTKPLQKSAYLMGRFWGSTLIAVVPMLGISLGVIISGAIWGFVEPERWGPISWGAHLWGILIFALPNTIFISAIVFAIAVWTRSTIASFIGVIFLLVGYSIAGNLLGNLDNEKLAMLLDPLGIRTSSVMTKFWTTAERNSQYLTLSGMLFWNRALWMSVGMGILGLACSRFSFTQRANQGRTRIAEAVAPSLLATLPAARIQSSRSTALSQLIGQARVDFWGITRSTVFIVIMFAGMTNMLAGLMFAEAEGFGLGALPVTYHMVDMIRGTMYLFLLAMMTFYAGVLVWRERESTLDEVYDALPHPTWISYTAKLIALTLIVAIVMALGIASGVSIQAIKGFTRFQIGLYAQELLVIDLLQFFLLTVLAMFAHIVAPNKYVGYFLFIVLVIVNSFVWSWVDVTSLMVQYGSMPSYTYSDMFGIAPFAGALWGFGIYWFLFAIQLSFLNILLWQRGRELHWGRRMSALRSRWSGGLRILSVLVLIVWGGVASWVYYNTIVLNEIRTAERVKVIQSDYERKFKRHEVTAQPRITRVKYNIDIFPERRAIELRAEQTIQNRTDQTIEFLYINTADRFETQIEIERTELVEDFRDLNFRTYRISPAMVPGESLQMKYTVKTAAKGFENAVTHRQIVQNGTFFNNGITPQIGYQSTLELTNKRDRAKKGLPPPAIMPPLEPANLEARSNTYISNNSDWVEIESVISTSADQMAIGPGSLQKTWTEGNRRYFHYKIDQASLNFYSFISARYKVARDKWNDVDIEVYYHPEHEWNVPKMVNSVRKSLKYCSDNFGPYRHKQARIIEFPRVAEFAQAFPGTMPYSEGIGFIADIKHDDDIDMVFYVVAHEMAHQWWAHQVIGANMQGGTLLSETLAQYSSLMVMEQEYGRDTMRKFLQYEMDNYLRSRGRELLKEQPLLRVEANQGYVHYRKGSVVMYQLKEMIGEDKVNAALRSIVEKFAYKDAPYPTSVDLVDALRAQTPTEMQSLYNDLFEEITLFGNSTTSATCKLRDDGKFDVKIEIDCRKFVADDKGAEVEVPMDDWVEIGAFAKTERKKRFGKTLHRERVKVQSGINKFAFVVDEVPETAGVDPFSLLIDRIPADNMRKTTE